MLPSNNQLLGMEERKGEREEGTQEGKKERRKGRREGRKKEGRLPQH